MTFYLVAWGGTSGPAEHRTRIATLDALQRFIDKLAADPDIDAFIVHIHRVPLVHPNQIRLPT